MSVFSEKRILVPMMFYEIDKFAIQYADAWAQRSGGKIYFFHALNISDRFYSQNIENIFETRNDEVISDVNKKVEEFLEDLNLQSEYEVVCKVGKPYHEIINLQQELHIEVIVMASHAHSFSERKLLGKTTNHVIHYSQCPVYVYKEHTRTFANKIIVPLGNISSYRITDTERHIVKLADEWALRRESEIYFMHATRLTERFYIPDIEQIYESKMGTEEAFESLNNKLNEFIAAFDVKSPYECVIRDGKSPQKIIDQQQSLKAKLVIMSNNEQNAFKRMMLGSTTDYVLHHSRCPIYVYKTPKEAA